MMARDQRPRIGVTTSARGGWWMWMFNRFSLWRAGARAVRIHPDSPCDLDDLQGLLVGGGDDIGVGLYHAQPEPMIAIDPARDDLECGLVRKAHERAMPVLGVCRGAQMINVAFGGSLHRDIHDVYRSAPRLRTVLPRKRVHLDPQSRLAAMLRGQRFRVNALHRQSIDRLGQDLVAVGHDHHQIIQAIETTRSDRFCFGVQWHPEFLIFNPHHKALFGALAKAARCYTHGHESQGADRITKR
ncbi:MULTISPECIES: gamma-glutamyl-gamma-aminobutyrate hydrolase family protein [unclassified Iodidimonas]|uniref:gamma-glutamyl-gamma-aminobutyrate hydrolase family protein n=1 Tax=unclassified Iodidimonas TaxID=2626145 RepID=UPI002482E122|nr:MULTISPECIES: gamma-glutamyl-gamma-aminobutyrate hydrolase family protein [unclassified Iodidimonas]